MAEATYKDRIVDSLIKEKLEAKGALLIRGPKWCGKTTTSEQFSKSVIYMNQIGKMTSNIELAKIDPQFLLTGLTPRLIDEWQIAPELWDAIRFEIDHRREPGQFILTGSAVPLKSEARNKIFHSGTGRFGIIDMLPMTLFESGESTGEVSLEYLFSGPEVIRGINKLSLSDIAFITCRGGWPYALNTKLSKKAALSQARDYVDLVVEEDISRVDNTNRNAERARAIMRSYARLQGTQTSVGLIRQDVAANDSAGLSDDTISSYLTALREIFVIKDLMSWNPNLLSKAAIRTTPTRYFSDPSIAAASLRFGPQDLINNLVSFGHIFETLCIRDLRVYTESLDGDLYHYRDSNGLECDAVVHLRNGKYGLIEIKLGGERLIEEGAANLIKFEKIIDTKKMGAPSFKMILTAVGDFAYRRKDGIYLVPIGCLKN